MYKSSPETISSSKRWKRLTILHWTSTPSWMNPHGLSGLISLMCGLYLTFFHTLTGNLTPFYDENHIPCLLLVYIGSTVSTAVAGFRLSPHAVKYARKSFRQSAILLIALCYFIARFAPQFTQAMNAIRHSSTFLFPSLVSEQFYQNALAVSVQVMDGIMATCLCLCILSFNSVIFDPEIPAQVSIAVCCGSTGLLLLAVYPIQLAVFGQDWWMCIQSRYPMQAPGMVAFIYVPATLTFNLIMFGATLHLRKIVTATELGMVMILVILFCFLGTVLVQEVHIPDVSTQRLYLPCQEPMKGSYAASWVRALDFSRYARKMLHGIFGIEFESEL